MNRLQSARWLVLMLVLLSLAAGIPIQAQEEEGYKPTVGQPGKDVVWVPTSEDLVNKMLDLAQVTANDYVIDLGSGDGRTVIAAAKRGAHALGIEYNPEMVELSNRNAAAAGVSDKASFVKADLFESDFSKATVITMFLLPDINLKLRPKLLSLKPGTRIVSNSFTMEEWQADGNATADGNCMTWCTAYLWIVPAQVEGKWKLPQGELALEQRFQNITGTLLSGAQSTPIRGKMIGDQIDFSSGESEYSGKVSADGISGTITTRWSASREK